jgi:hypothetical protein
MGSGKLKPKVAVLNYAMRYETWTYDMKTCSNECVAEIERAIKAKSEHAQFSWDSRNKNGPPTKGTTPTLRHLDRDEVHRVYNALSNYYANDRGYDVNMGGNNTGSGVSLYKFNLIDEYYLNNHLIPGENAPYPVSIKHMRAQFVADFLTIVEKWFKEETNEDQKD